jgi:hypothetical protein
MDEKKKQCRDCGGLFPLSKFRIRTEYRRTDGKATHSHHAKCDTCRSVLEKISNDKRRAKERKDRENPVEHPMMTKFLYPRGV